MKILESLGILIRGDLSKLPQDIDSGTKQLNRLSQKADEVGKQFEGIGTAVSSFIGKLALVGAGKKAFDAFSQMESSMISLRSHAGLTASEMEALGAKVQKSARQMTMNPAEMITGIEDLAQRGYSLADAYDIMSASAQLAKSRNFDLATTIEAVSANMQSYGVKAKDVSKITDVLFSATELGGLSMEQLSTSLGTLNAYAGPLGLSLKDVVASIIAIRRGGESSARAVSGLQRILMVLSTGRKGKLDEITKNVLGFKNATEAIKSMGLTSYLSKVASELDDAGDGFGALGGQSKNSAIALKLVADNGRTFDNALQELNNDSGALQTKIAAMSQSSAESMRQLTASVNEMAIQFGQVLAPQIKKVVDSMTGMVDKFSSMTEAQKSFAVDAGATLLVIGPLVSAIAKLMSGIFGLVGALRVLPALLASISAPVVAMTAFFFALGAAIGHALDRMTGLSNVIGTTMGNKAWVQQMFGVTPESAADRAMIEKGAQAKAKRLQQAATAGSAGASSVEGVAAAAGTSLAARDPILTEDQLKAQKKMEEAIFKTKFDRLSLDEKINAILEKRKKLEKEIKKEADMEKRFALQEQAVELEGQMIDLQREKAPRGEVARYAGAATQGSVEAYKSLMYEERPISGLEKTGKNQLFELKKINEAVTDVGALLKAQGIATVSI